MSEAVAGTAADLGLLPAEAQPEAASSEQTEALEPEQEPVEDYNPQVPDEIEMFLAEEELDLDDEPVVASEEYQDPDDLARRLAKAERALAHEREQRIRVSLKSWKQEGQKFFPLADLDNITADSRRGYLRAARDQHERNLRILEPQLRALKAAQGAADEAAAKAARDTEASKWGRPVTNAGGGVPTGSTNDERLLKARQKGDFTAATRALLERI